MRKTLGKQKESKMRKIENPNFSKPGTRRQRSMLKKELQRSISKIKKKAVRKRTIKINSEKALAETSKKGKNAWDQNRPVNKEKSAQDLKCKGVQLKGPERAISSGSLKLDIGSQKHESNDIRSIVQRNIRKYRELRKKQLKAGLRERLKKNMPYQVVRQSRSSSEPLSKNMDIYIKPLERGWRRELVHRVNGPDAAGKSDVYYCHPNGKKLRSTREIANNLTEGLTIDCFTFRREALGCGEPQEIVRNARLNKTPAAANKKT